MRAVAWAWDRITTLFLPPRLRTDPDLERRARLLILITLLLIAIALIRVAQLSSVGEYLQAAFALGGALASLGILALLQRTGRVGLAASILIGLMMVIAGRMAYLRGGVGAPMLIGLAVLPAVATFFGGARGGAVAVAMIASLVAGFAFVEHGLGVPIEDRIPHDVRLRLDVLAPLLMAFFTYGISLAYEWTRSAARLAQARAERHQRGAEDAARMLQADRMASVGQLAAGVAHEINNPLAYITANLAFVQEQLALMGPSANDETRQALAEAREGIERVASIVLDLKTFTREDASNANLLDLRVVLDSTLRIVENEIKHRAELVRRYPADPAFVLATEPRLVQVFLNLLMNALQALPAGKTHENAIAIEVKLDARGFHHVSVSDTGPGMPPEVLARAMDPFFTTKPVGVGTGLGLAVCRNVVRGLGGEIQIESAVGRGTQVIVTLPPPPASITRPRPVSLAPEPLSKQARLKVLVIDDDPLVGRGLRRQLQHHDVTAVTSGHDAILALQRGQRFELILCDLMMPGLTGADVYEQVAALGKGMEEHFVFLTGGVFSDSVRDFLDRIPNPRLTKPVSTAQLETVLATAARRAARTASSGEARAEVGPGSAAPRLPNAEDSSRPVEGATPGAGRSDRASH
jgi:signal transduction histidine kinase/DNA-binding NarL/FixJ family response regulator